MNAPRNWDNLDRNQRIHDQDIGICHIDLANDKPILQLLLVLGDFHHALLGLFSLQSWLAQPALLPHRGIVNIS